MMRYKTTRRDGTESFYDLPNPDWNGGLAAWQKLEARVKPGIERQTLQLHEANILLQLGRRDEARALLEQVTEPILESNKKKLVARLAETTDKTP